MPRVRLAWIASELSSATGFRSHTVEVSTDEDHRVGGTLRTLSATLHAVTPSAGEPLRDNSRMLGNPEVRGLRR